MAGDFLSGTPEMMAAFRPIGPDATVATAEPASAGGGIPAAGSFVQAYTGAVQSLQGYMRNVDQGFKAYADAAKQSAEEYAAADRAGAGQMCLAPADLGQVSGDPGSPQATLNGMSGGPR